VSGVVTASLLPDLPRRKHEEDDLLYAAMEFLDLALPIEAIAHHSPGEGKRSKRAQGHLKRSGYRKGWPDIQILWRGHSDVFIELKVPGRAPDPDQRELHKRLTICCGCVVIVCKTLGCIEESLRELGMPLRARVAA
jgi:hypothetical protein